MKATCQCGQLSASVPDAATPYVVACHCRDCQKRSGSPFGVMAYFPHDSVTISGEAVSFSRATDSGHSYTTRFCPACGTSLIGEGSRLPEITGIAIGCFDEGTLPAPVRSVYEQGKVDWVDLTGEVAHHPRGRDS